MKAIDRNTNNLYGLALRYFTGPDNKTFILCKYKYPHFVNYKCDVYSHRCGNIPLKKPIKIKPTKKNKIPNHIELQNKNKTSANLQAKRHMQKFTSSQIYNSKTLSPMYYK